MELPSKEWLEAAAKYGREHSDGPFKIKSNITISIVQTGESIKVDVNSDLKHDDVVMFYLIEAIYRIRNKEYDRFFPNGVNEVLC